MMPDATSPNATTLVTLALVMVIAWKSFPAIGPVSPFENHITVLEIKVLLAQSSKTVSKCLHGCRNAEGGNLSYGHIYL